jgi:nitrogenase-stabilizing/protective protein
MLMAESELDLDLDELVSAEDFLEYFDVAFDPAVVHVNRLHILQRFHDYLAGADDATAVDDDARHALFMQALTRAYADFVVSDARTEKVFRVFHAQAPTRVEVPLTDLVGLPAT